MPAARIVYAHPCKQISFLRYAKQCHVATMTFDNEAELHKIQAVYPEARHVGTNPLNAEHNYIHSILNSVNSDISPISTCFALLLHAFNNIRNELYIRMTGRVVPVDSFVQLTIQTMCPPASLASSWPYQTIWQGARLHCFLSPKRRNYFGNYTFKGLQLPWYIRQIIYRHLSEISA